MQVLQQQENTVSCDDDKVEPTQQPNGKRPAVDPPHKAAYKAAERRATAFAAKQSAALHNVPSRSSGIQALRV